jgi:predicted nucleotidyltransferase
MDNLIIQPTLYPEVNLVLQQLLTNAQEVLGDHFVGLYLYGSLASGDFNPQTSDIDFVVVTSDELSAEMIAALEGMHLRLRDSGPKWARKLEGAYLPLHALRRYDPDATPCPAINEGRFYVERPGSDWVIQRHVLREFDARLAGPSLRDLIDPVLPDDLRQAIRGVLHAWWEPMLHDPAWIRGGEYQAFAILTMCRALYTFQHGTIASKPVSARWAQQTLGERWTSLIEWALTWEPAISSDNLSETLEFIRYTIERS